MNGDRKPAWMRWGSVLLALVLAVLLALWLKNVLTSEGPVKKPAIQQITLVRPPPPPPPPPPPEQKMPEPEIKEEVKLDQPEPTPDEPQPQADAPPPDGIAEGPAGGMATDIARGVPTLPGSGGGRGNPWAWYDALLNDAVNSAFQNALSQQESLKQKSYRVIVKVWLDANGKVSRAQLVDSTGDARADEVLKEALNDMRALREGPPSDMPQPVKIRVISRA